VSNMTVNQRNQYDRATYAGSAERIRHGSQRGATIFNVIAVIVAAALCFTAITVIDGWSQWLVLGVIVFTTVGLMIAVSPNRRG
jgi:hypothetical protein